MLDGEAGGFAAERYDFHALRWPSVQRTAHMIAFDLLWLDGRDMRERPVEGRRRVLQRLLTSQNNPALTFSAEIEGDGPRFRARLRART